MNASSLIVLVLVVGALALMFNRTRRQQREAQSLQSHLTVGAQIMTTAGLFARVVEVDDTSVTLETAPGQRSRWDKRAVARVVPEPDGPAPLSDEAGGVDDVEAVQEFEGQGRPGGPGVADAPTESAPGSVDAGDSSTDSTPPDRG